MATCITAPGAYTRLVANTSKMTVRFAYPEEWGSCTFPSCPEKRQIGDMEEGTSNSL